MESNFDNNISIPLLNIPKSTQYWFVRAYGGKYYSEFLEEGYIGLGDDRIRIADIEDYSEKDGFKNISSLENIKIIYKVFYPEYTKQQVTLFSKRLFNFLYSMKENDIVIVPSKSSERFLVGVIQGEPYDSVIHLEAETEDKKDIFKKRRDVIWIKEIKRKELPEKMYWVLSAHQSFFNIDEYAEQLGSLLSPLYMRDNEVIATFHVGTQKEITIKDWGVLQEVLIHSAGDQAGQISLKIDVQSPGEIILLGSIDNLEGIIEIGKNIISMVQDNPSSTFWVFAAIFGGVQYKDFNVFGIIPYFFGEGKLRREKMKAENKSLQLDHEIKTHRFEMEKKKDLSELKITPKDPGNVISLKKQIDYTNMDEE